MKTLLTYCLLMLSSISFSQYNTITLTHKTKRQKIAEIKSKELIRVVTKQGSSNFGTLSFISDPVPAADSMIIVSNDTIKISDIVTIKVYPAEFRYTGITMMVIGIPLFITGITLIPEAAIIEAVFDFFLSAVGISTAITGMVFIFVRHTYKTDKWDISIN